MSMCFTMFHRVFIWFSSPQKNKGMIWTMIHVTIHRAQWTSYGLRKSQRNVPQEAVLTSYRLIPAAHRAQIAQTCLKTGKDYETSV